MGVVIAPTLDLAGRRALVTGRGAASDGLARCAWPQRELPSSCWTSTNAGDFVADEVGGEPIVLDLSDVDAVASSLSTSTSW